LSAGNRPKSYAFLDGILSFFPTKLVIFAHEDGCIPAEAVNALPFCEAKAAMEKVFCYSKSTPT